MFNFQKKVNPNDKSHYYEAQFQSRLVSASPENVLENVNGTEYILGVVEFESAKGETIQRNAMIYMSNWKQGMKEGGEYLTTVRINPNDDRGPLVFVSHLTSAPRATTDEFGFSLEDVKATKASEKVAATVADDEEVF